MVMNADEFETKERQKLPKIRNYTCNIYVLDHSLLCGGAAFQYSCLWCR